MPMDRSKFKNIVGGITTPVPAVASPEEQAATPIPGSLPPTPENPAETAEGQGSASPEPVARAEKPVAAPAKRFAKTGRPKGQATGKSTKTKVSLFIDKTLIDELYDWAYQDRIQPGELFERALRDYRNREAKRRNSGTA